MTEEDQMPNLGMLDIGAGSDRPGHDGQDRGHAENCNLIVNYLPHDIDDLSLKGLFVEFGEIVMTKVVTDRNTKKSLGYGFVKFAKEDDAKMAIQRLNGFTIDHKCLKVSVARPPSLEIRNCKLYVTNLPKDYSEQDVIDLFKEFGEIIECRVLKDKGSRSNKGVAFVQFDNKSQANSALSLNGCQLDGSSRGLVVKYAEDQHKKREMTRLQNLTSHNVYRYMQPGEQMSMPGMHNMQGMQGMQTMQNMPGMHGMQHMHSLHGDPYKQPMRPMERVDSHGAPPFYYPNMAQPSQHQNRHPPAQSVPAPQPHQGLGGINAFYGGASAQPLPHLQVPAVTLGQSGGVLNLGLPSPVMGSVSPNHYLYQQQQLMQQALGRAGPPSPIMSPSYSPRGGRGRGGGRGGGRGFLDGTADLLLQSPSPPSQQQQQQQYGGAWYASQPPQQPQMSFIGAGSSGSLTIQSPTHGLYGHAQHQPPHQQPPRHVAMDLGGLQMGLSPAQQPRSPLVPHTGGMPMMQHQPSLQAGGGYGGTMHTSHGGQHPHTVPPMASSPRTGAGLSPLYSPPQQQLAPAGMAMLQASPYMSSNASYAIDGGRKTVSTNASTTSGGAGAGSVTLNVSNLPPNADVAFLHDLFAPYGRLLSAQIDVDVSGAPGAPSVQGNRVSVCSGRGRVQMAGITQADAAAKGVSGVIRGAGAPIQVSVVGAAPAAYPSK